MKQLIRRTSYLLVGAAAATYLLTELPLSHISWFSAASILGTAGLYIAAALTFPVKRSFFWAIALLLGFGLCAMLPWSVILTYAFISNAIEGEPISLGEVSHLAWLFIGPILVACHFLAKARRTPNNSFNPDALKRAG